MEAVFAGHEEANAVTVPAGSTAMRADFAALYQARFADLAGQLYAFTGDASETHDLVQEAFIRAWQRWATVGQYDDPVAAVGPDRVALIEALRTLPEHHRRALVLHYLADLSVNEIANDIGVAVGTVKSWLHRGRPQLAAQLRDEYEGNNRWCTRMTGSWPRSSRRSARRCRPRSFRCRPPTCTPRVTRAPGSGA